MGRIGALGAVLLAGAARADAPPPLTLPEAIRQALAHNLSLVRSARQVERDARNVDSARAAFGTRLSPDSQAGWTEDGEQWQYGLGLARKLDFGADVRVGGRVRQTRSDALSTEQRTVMEVQLSQPLFRRFGSLVQQEPVRLAESALRTAQRAREQQKVDLVVQLVTVFENMLLQEKRIAFDEGQFARADRLLRLTKAREKQGRTTRVDTLRVELQRGQAEARLTASRERLSFARRELAELLGQPPDTAYALVAPALLAIETPPAEDAVQAALAHRMDIAQAWQDREDRARGVRVAARAQAPDLSLIGRYQRAGEGGAFGSSSSLDEDNWFVGVAALTEFNPASNRAALAGARSDAQAAETTVQLVERTVAREVQQQLAAYQRAQSELAIAQRNEVLAEHRARLSRTLFENGRADNFSVTDAEDAYLQARTLALEARAEASVSGYRLLRSMGCLIDHPASLRAAVYAQARDDPLPALPAPPNPEAPGDSPP